jgi:hypothetical protein
MPKGNRLGGKPVHAIEPRSFETEIAKPPFEIPRAALSRLSKFRV